MGEEKISSITAAGTETVSRTVTGTQLEERIRELGLTLPAAGSTGKRWDIYPL